MIASTHDTLLCFSNRGKMYWLKVYQLPLASRISRGKPIVNVLPLAADEEITAMLPVREYLEGLYVFMATKFGTVKKVSLVAFSRPRSNGIIAVDLDEGDQLVGVDITQAEQDVMLFTDAGKVVRFGEGFVRATGRTARGVRGIRLAKDQSVISLVVVKSEGTILTATENGYGKRTEIGEYRRVGRGSQGVISIQVTERNGKVIRAAQVDEGDEVMLITDQGTLVRFRVSDLSIISRNTQGVRLINVKSGEQVVGMQRIEDLGEVDGNEPVDGDDAPDEAASDNASPEIKSDDESSEKSDD